jgi:YD repeat-containing protein
VRITAVSVVLAVLAVSTASASVAKPKPLVPTFIQTLVQKKAGSLAYVPTRAPFGHRYVRYRWDASRRLLTITIADRRLPIDGRHSIAFTARRFTGTLASCGDGREKSLQMGGNRVFWDGAMAWRCVRGRDGRLVRIAASGPNLPDVALGRVVASGKRVS